MISSSQCPAPLYHNSQPQIVLWPTSCKYSFYTCLISVRWHSAKCCHLLNAKNHAGRWISYAKLPLGVNECDNVFMNAALWWTDIPFWVYSHNNRAVVLFLLQPLILCPWLLTHWVLHCRAWSTHIYTLTMVSGGGRNPEFWGERKKKKERKSRQYILKWFFFIFLVLWTWLIAVETRENPIGSCSVDHACLFNNRHDEWRNQWHVIFF